MKSVLLVLFFSLGIRAASGGQQIRVVDQLTGESLAGVTVEFREPGQEFGRILGTDTTKSDGLADPPGSGDYRVIAHKYDDKRFDQYNREETLVEDGPPLEIKLRRRTIARNSETREVIVYRQVFVQDPFTGVWVPRMQYERVELTSSTQEVVQSYRGVGDGLSGCPIPTLCIPQTCPSPCMPVPVASFVRPDICAPPISQCSPGVSPQFLPQSVPRCFDCFPQGSFDSPIYR